jgi:3-oxoacyl-[acyl-carrier-protein] synthase-3
MEPEPWRCEACPASDSGLLGFGMRSDGSRNACLTLAQTNEHHEPLLDGVTAQTAAALPPIQMNGQEV